MQMIEIAALDNGAHRNQTYHGFLPTGWAVIPDTVTTENFPFGKVVVEDVDGVPTVVSWEPLPMPEPESPEDVDYLQHQCKLNKVFHLQKPQNQRMLHDLCHNLDQVLEQLVFFPISQNPYLYNVPSA